VLNLKRFEKRARGNEEQEKEAKMGVSAFIPIGSGAGPDQVRRRSQLKLVDSGQLTLKLLGLCAQEG